MFGAVVQLAQLVIPFVFPCLFTSFSFGKFPTCQTLNIKIKFLDYSLWQSEKKCIFAN